MKELLKFFSKSEKVSLSIDGAKFIGEISTLEVSGHEVPLLKISPEGNGITTLRPIAINQEFFRGILERTGHWSNLQRLLSRDTVFTIAPDSVNRFGVNVSFQSSPGEFCHMKIHGAKQGNVVENLKLSNISSPEDFNLVYYNSRKPIVAINITLKAGGN